MILVTGGTGANGIELTTLLSPRGVRVRAMVRRPDRAQAIAGLAGVDLVTGDFDDPRLLKAALQGVERAFLLTNSSERAEAQKRAFVDAGRHTGLRHVVKLPRPIPQCSMSSRLAKWVSAPARRCKERPPADANRP